MIERMNERIKGYFKLLVRLNYLKTLYFNFKMLPLKDACKFPFLFFGKDEFGTLTGSIVISSSIKTGMFRWGVMIDGFTSSKVSSHFSLGRKARLEINGRVDVGCGVVFRILGDLTLLNNSFIGSRTVVACSHKIFLGEFVRVAFGNVLMDTNHHYIVHDGCVHRKEGSIIIGNRCWIGNNSHISKGCVLPSNTIVAARSFVAKDYRECGEYCLLVGSPAKMKQTDVRRLYDLKLEQAIQNYFDLHENEETYCLSNDEIGII